MKCAGCEQDFASSYLKPWTYAEPIAGLAVLHTLQLCRSCFQERKNQPRIAIRPVRVP